MSKRFQYEVHTTEVLTTTGQKLDVVEWLNTLGADGWEVLEVNQSVANSGMLDDKQQPIPKIVVQSLCKREIFADKAAPDLIEYADRIVETVTDHCMSGDCSLDSGASASVRKVLEELTA